MLTYLLQDVPLFGGVSVQRDGEALASAAARSAGPVHVVICAIGRGFHCGGTTTNEGSKHDKSLMHHNKTIQPSVLRRSCRATRSCSVTLNYQFNFWDIQPSGSNICRLRKRKALVLPQSVNITFLFLLSSKLLQSLACSCAISLATNKLRLFFDDQCLAMC